MPETFIHGQWSRETRRWTWSVEQGQEAWRDARGRVRLFSSAASAERAWHRHRDRLRRLDPRAP